MPSAFREPKSLPEWIEPDYHERSRGLRRFRQWAVWGTLLTCAVGLAAAAFFPRSARLYEAGPVSEAHAMFNNDCAKCHTEAWQTPKRFLPGNATVHAVPDSACTACHPGPPHNDKLLATQNCAGCHREHRGRPVLARVPDRQCTACHADLKAHSKDGPACPFEDVRGFPDGHPEFAKLTDPGQIHFNHKIHLESPIVREANDNKDVDCSQCHVADSAGRYMQPVNYANHCAKCHPLSVQLAGDFKDEQLKKAAEDFAKIPALHEKPAIVRADLRERLLRFVKENPVVPGEPAMVLDLPKPRPPEVTEKQWNWVKNQLSKSDLLFTNPQLPHLEKQQFLRPGGCLYCHISEKPALNDELPVYKETNIPNRWMTHSKFSHLRHRMVGCTECHKKAKDSTQTSDVLMPTKESCAECHSPPGHSPTAGVRNDCVECHQYHPR
jgi:hypothetical protein